MYTCSSLLTASNRPCSKIFGKLIVWTKRKVHIPSDKLRPKRSASPLPSADWNHLAIHLPISIFWRLTNEIVDFCRLHINKGNNSKKKGKIKTSLLSWLQVMRSGASMDSNFPRDKIRRCLETSNRRLSLTGRVWAFRCVDNMQLSFEEKTERGMGNTLRTTSTHQGSCWPSLLPARICPPTSPWEDQHSFRPILPHSQQLLCWKLWCSSVVCVCVW